MDQAAALALVLMVAVSECHLHSRKPTSLQDAQAAAEEALAWASASAGGQVLSTAPAIRQLGRVALASGDIPGAELQLEKVGFFFTIVLSQPQSPLAEWAMHEEHQPPVIGPCAYCSYGLVP